MIVIKPRRQQQLAGDGAAMSKAPPQLGERSDGVVRTFSNPAAAVRFLAQRIVTAED